MNFFKTFLILILCAFAITVISNWVLISDDIFFDTFGESLSYEKISDLINSNKKWRWTIYPVTIGLYLTKFALISICFSIGSLIFGLENDFKKFFQIATNAEFIFLIPLIIKLIWFSLVKTDFNLEDLQYFSPLSVFSLFNPRQVEPWLVYPLQLLNIFEVLYWLALAYQLRNLFNKSLKESIGFVTYTYGAGLLTWVVVFMFLFVSIS